MKIPLEVQRDAARKSILANGFRSSRGAFAMAFESEELDASLLIVPVGWFPPARGRASRLDGPGGPGGARGDGLVYRYRIPDGTPGSDATFTFCSFWLVINLALAGRTSEAGEWFETSAASPTISASFPKRSTLKAAGRSATFRRALLTSISFALPSIFKKRKRSDAAEEETRGTFADARTERRVRKLWKTAIIPKEKPRLAVERRPTATREFCPETPRCQKKRLLPCRCTPAASRVTR